MRESRYWIVGLVILGLILTAQTTLGQEEDLKVPFSAIKSSCYGEIDMSKAEFDLSEVGEECVNQDWLKENLPSDSEEKENIVKEKKRNRVKTSKEKEIVVPMDAVHVLKWRKAKHLSEDQNRNDDKVKVPVSWVKPEWLIENRPEIETPMTLATKEPTLDEVVEVINTPEQLVKFMNKYFEFWFHKGRLSYSPDKFLSLKKGDCKDWSVFIGHILKENGYKAKQLAYSPQEKEVAHVILIYWKKNDLYYITVSLGGATIYGSFQNIEEILQSETKRVGFINKKITCYILAPATKLKIEKSCL